MKKCIYNIKKLIMAMMALSLFLTIGISDVKAHENNMKSGIYEVENDVYHESETGMAMSRSYLLPVMIVEVTHDNTIYTIGFSGSEYMENYRIMVNGQEVPVEISEESDEEGIVKVSVEVDKIDADIDVLIYIGPMERDVQFKVIPKLETLTLIEEIKEEVLEVSPEAEELSETVDDNEITKSNVGVLGVGIAIIAAGSIIGITIIKKRK